MDAYEKLGNAIILQAVKDYRTTLKRLKRHPRNCMDLSSKQEIERFFRSPFFSKLTSVDPEVLINKLGREVV